MISKLYTCRQTDDPEASILLRKLNSSGFDKIRKINIEKVYRFEGIENHSAKKLFPLICNPSVEKVSDSSLLDPDQGHIFETGYQRAVSDPELPSVLRAAEALKIQNLEWIRIAHRYQFIGIDKKTAEEIVRRYLFNPQVQLIISDGEAWDTLKPKGETGPVRTIPLGGLSESELVRLSEDRRLFLDRDQMKILQNYAGELKRDLTDAEMEMFAQTWSDHCFHTTWKSLGLLKALWEATTEINHPLVLSVFEDNAGAMEFYDGWALTIKGETHNSPTAVSPYGGIMTKHGGVIRDTLGCGQGAKPIGGSTVMGLGDPNMDWRDVPKGALHPQTILTESIRGTADYTNPMGIPMMFPVYKFHPGYTGKCLALGHSIGLIPADRAKKGHPQPGDIAILIGGLTGRDGLHGATVSSSSMTSDTHVVDAAHVQIGHPIEERKFMEVIPVLRDSNCLRAITDLGAAGLSSAAGEMGSDTGIWINLALVPLKTEGMYPWEIWISESQERMLLCVPPENLSHAKNLLDRYETPWAVIGKFTDTKRCQVIFDAKLNTTIENMPISPDLSGETVVDLDFHMLRKGCPLPKFEIKNPAADQSAEKKPLLKGEDSWKNAVLNVLGHLNCADQSYAGFQFDKTVQGITVVQPFGGMDGRMPNDIWMAAPIRGKTFGTAASVAFNPLYGDVNPVQMARLMMIESISKLVTCGVSSDEIVLCDNFYTPRINNETACLLKEMVLECCELSKQFKTPFISGKDSSSGTFISEDGKRLDIPPTLAVMAMGRLPDVRKRIQKEWTKDGHALLLAGPLSAELGGSVFYNTQDITGGKLPNSDANQILKFWKKLRGIQDEGLILSASSLGEGGLMRRLFEMALGSGYGCQINLDAIRKKLNGASAESAIFAEMIGAVVIEVLPEQAEYLLAECGGVHIGQTVKPYFIEIQTERENMKFDMSELISAWEKPFAEAAR